MMRYLAFYIIWDIITTEGEWVELPKLSPLSDKEKNMQNPLFIEKSHPSSNDSTNITPVPLDYNLEQILLQVHKSLTSEDRGQSTIGKKEHFLQKIQKRLLSDIWGRSHIIWTGTGVESRGHGHMMTFPSLEGALLTIAFLTFAVFLIKIVKQFIQGLQGANGSVVGIEVAGTPAKVVKHKRSTPHRKDTQSEENFQCSKDAKVCKNT